MEHNTILLPGLNTQIAVLKENSQVNNVVKPCELTIIQAEYISDRGNVIPARSITIRKIEAIEALSDFLLDILSDYGSRLR